MTKNYLTYYNHAACLQDAIWILQKTKFAPQEGAKQEVINFALQYIEQVIQDLIKCGDDIRENDAAIPTRPARPSTRQVF